MDQQLLEEAVRRGILSPEEAKQYAEPGPITQESQYNPWLGAAQSVGTGIVKGAVSGTIGLPGDLEALAQWGYKKVTGDEPWEAKVPGVLKSEFYTDPKKGIARALLHQPQNQLERSLEAGAEGVTAFANPAGLVGKGKLLTVPGALLGVGAGVTGEAAREFAPQNKEAASLAVQAPFILAQLYRGGRTPNTVKAAKDYVADLGPEGLAEADRVRRAATAATATPPRTEMSFPTGDVTQPQVVTRPAGPYPEGVPTLLHQGTEHPTALNAMAQEIASSREGVRTRGVAAAQRGAEEPLIRSFAAGPTRLSTDFEPGARVRLQRDADALNRLSPQTYAHHALQYAWQNPDRYAQMLKLEFQTAAEKALGEAVGGYAKPNSLTTFVNEVAGRPRSEKRMLFEEKIRVLNKARQLPPEVADEAAKGASQYMDALLVLDRDRPSATQLRDFRQQGGDTLLARIMKASWVAPIRVGGQALDRIVFGHTVRYFDKAMTDPEGVKMMLDIARFGPWSNKGLAAIGTLMRVSAIQNAAPEPRQEPAQFGMPDLFGGINQE